MRRGQTSLPPKNNNAEELKRLHLAHQLDGLLNYRHRRRKLAARTSRSRGIAITPMPPITACRWAMSLPILLTSSFHNGQAAYRGDGRRRDWRAWLRPPSCPEEPLTKFKSFSYAANTRLSAMPADYYELKNRASDGDRRARQLHDDYL